MISLADTNKMDNIANEISKATNELENEINSLFRRFSNVPHGTKEWTGEKSEFYFSKTAAEKRQYDVLVNRLRRFSREISSTASDVRSAIEAANNQS